MGGPGSGRQRRKMTVEGCRTLDLGEICDGAALRRLPRGEIAWGDLRAGRTHALLCYAAAEVVPRLGEPWLLLCYVYWPTPTAYARSDEIELIGGGGKRYAGRCPGCERPVRKLYAPPGEVLFLCRLCHHLRYDGSARAKALRRRAVLGPVLAELAAMQLAGQAVLSSSEARRIELLKATLGLADAGPAGVRLACLRLRRAGLSYRQIAAHVYRSKSSVARYVAAGPAGIDLEGLYDEHIVASFKGIDRQFADGDLKAIDGELAAMDVRAKRLGLYRRPPPGEPEHGGLERQGGALERVSAEEEQVYIWRCYERLREQGQRRLSQSRT